MKLPSLTFKRTDKPGVYRVADRFTVWCESHKSLVPGWRVKDDRAADHAVAERFKFRNAAKRFMAVKLGLIDEHTPQGIVERLLEEMT